MRRLLAVTALFVFATFGASAQTVPLTKLGSGLGYTALGHVLEFPAPQWMSEAEAASADPLPLFEATNFDDGAKAELDLVRKGETSSNWTHHYEARIMLAPDTPLTTVRQDIVLELSQVCAPDKSAFFQFTADNPDAPPALGFACGAYLDTLTDLTSKGEVAVVVFKRTDKGVATVIERWRGAAFDTSAPALWPISTTVVQQRATLLDIATTLRVAQ